MVTYCLYRNPQLLHRASEAMLDTGVLPNSHGWAVHDGLKSYFGFGTVRHALCNAHHLRELEFAHEQYDATWAKHMQKLLLKMKKHDDEQTLTKTLIRELETCYDQLIQEGFKAFPIQTRPPDHKGRYPQLECPRSSSFIDRSSTEMPTLFC